MFLKPKSYLFLLGLNAANAGGEKLSGTTSSMDQRSYDQYNQTMISGAIALNCIKNYGNSELVVIVNTLRNNGLNASNYGAALAPEGTSLDAIQVFNYDTVAGLKPKSQEEYANVERVSTTQMVFTEIKNSNTVRATTKADINYITPTAKFFSVLIYDVNEDMIGIYLEQQVTEATFKANQVAPGSNPWGQDCFRLQNFDTMTGLWGTSAP